jgi:hypothetical protein
MLVFSWDNPIFLTKFSKIKEQKCNKNLKNGGSPYNVPSFSQFFRKSPGRPTLKPLRKSTSAYHQFVYFVDLSICKYFFFFRNFPFFHENITLTQKFQLYLVFLDSLCKNRSNNVQHLTLRILFVLSRAPQRSKISPHSNQINLLSFRKTI